MTGHEVAVLHHKSTQHIIIPQPFQNGKSVEDVECTVLEEFGRCMKQIINSAQSGVLHSGLSALLCIYVLRKAHK